ncbi:MAG: hypothetical protein QNK24_08085, partial [Desulfuromusa sp.]|nr:hypothetical protein [Desulfuromusa sp.]
NCHDFESFDDVIEHVAKVDSDKSLYHQYISAPAFTNGTDNEFVNEENLKRQLEKIFSGSTRSKVAGRSDRFRYWLHPSRPWDFASALYRRWKHQRTLSSR